MSCGSTEHQTDSGLGAGGRLDRMRPLLSRAMVAACSCAHMQGSAHAAQGLTACANIVTGVKACQCRAAGSMQPTLVQLMRG